MSLKPKAPQRFSSGRIRRDRRETGAQDQRHKDDPGHGVAGRHATRELLDALSGNKDPGMFGRMFPNLAAAQGQRRQAAGARQRDDRHQSRRSGRQQSEHPGRFHLSRPVRRSRHHARPHFARRQGEGSARHREFPHAERRSRLRLRPWPGRQPASLRAQSRRRKQARAEDADRQEHQHRRRRLPQRPAAQPGRLRADRRPSQRREPARRADASGDAEIPQRDLRHAVGRAPIRRPTSSRKRARSSPGTISGSCCTTGSSG